MRRIFTGKPPRMTGSANSALGRTLSNVRRVDVAGGRGGRRGPKNIGTTATLTTSLAGSNNDITYSAADPGVAGNNIRIRYVVSGNNTALSVSVSNNDITVNSATDGSGNATSTAQAVIQKIRQDSTARNMVNAKLASGNDGTGVIATMAFTNLAGGADAV